VLTIAALSLWLWHAQAAADAERLGPTSSSPATAAGTGLADGFATSADTATTAQQAALSALPETLRHPGAPHDPIARVQQRHAMSRFFADAQDIRRARAESTLMVPARPADAIGAMGILSERQQSDGRSFIRYEPRTLESRIEGDTLDIFLPGVGLTARAVVDRVDSVDGLLRWSGHFLDFQEGGTFSVTHALGDRYAVGTFDTPVGNFSMEAKNGWGWVAPPSSDFALPPGGGDGLHATAPQPDAAGPAGP
jgi:hypothetical protein